MIQVAFLDEGTLGHSSYLPRFVGELQRRPELGVLPHVLQALPLPPNLSRWGNGYLPWFRKHGLDFGGSRWRHATSLHLSRQLEALRAGQKIDAVIVNTQSVGLALATVRELPPLFVCLDATFRELENSPWFAPTGLAKAAHPLTMGWLRRAERRLFQTAHRLLPWSEHTARSLRSDYGIPTEKITPLPPSMPQPPARPPGTREIRLPQILFLGGNFSRKGGPLLLKVHQEHFADQCELHIVTFDEKPTGKNIVVHHGVKAGSPEWLRRWHEANLFVFPSALETFGIVLIEALAFGTPVISSNVGAACEVLDQGQAGILLDRLDASCLTAAIRDCLDQPSRSAERAAIGLQHFRDHYELGRNTERLVEWIRQTQ
jgi:hypothetical protein